VEGTGGVERTAFSSKRRLSTWATKQTLLLSLLLVVAVAALYYPVSRHDFFDIDDYQYVVDNVHIRDGLNWSTVKWALTSHSYANNWHPLTWLSHALDVQMFGLDPAGHHAVNVGLHALDVLLLFWIMLRATGYVGRSWMVAALFALHPMNVEAVAWVAERKTMLSMLFFLLALAAYRWYACTPRFHRYLAVVLLYLLGLMSKPQVITLPLLLLLWDYWPLQRMFAIAPESSSDANAGAPLPSRSFSWLVLEKVPLLLVCAAGALVTMHAQASGLASLPLEERLRPEYWAPKLLSRSEHAIFCYAKYIGKAFWPSAMAPEYPSLGASLRLWQVLGAAALLLAITVLVFAYWRRRYLVTGWLWFLISLVPMLGIVQAGRQAMADRYAYGSFLGLFMMVCWGVADWTRQRSISTTWLASAGLIVLLALATVAYRQVGYWRDSFTLWSHARQVVPNHWAADDHLGVHLLSEGKTAEAMAHFFRASTINPDDGVSNVNIGFYEQTLGNLREAIARYRRALNDPGVGVDDRARVWNNMGVAYRDLGDLTEARECFEKSARTRPNAGLR
jgi:protein O-mannosyl-transferase